MDNNFVNRTQNLVSQIQQASNTTTTQQLFNQFDNLDAEQTRYTTAAENYAGRPQQTEIYEWSRTLEYNGRLITYWKLRLHLRKIHIFTSSRMNHLKLDINPDDTGSNQKDFIKTNPCCVLHIIKCDNLCDIFRRFCFLYFHLSVSHYRCYNFQSISTTEVWVYDTYYDMTPRII